MSEPNFHFLNFAFDESGNCPELVNRATRIYEKFPRLSNYIHLQVKDIFNRTMCGDYPGVLFSLVCGNIIAIAKRKRCSIRAVDEHMQMLMQAGKQYRGEEINPWHMYRQPDWENFFSAVESLEIYSFIGFLSVLIEEADVFNNSDTQDEQIEAINVNFRRYVIEGNIAHSHEIWHDSSETTGKALDFLSERYPAHSHEAIQKSREYVAMVQGFMAENEAPLSLRADFANKTLGEALGYACFCQWSALGYGLMDYNKAIPYTDLYFQILSQLDMLASRYKSDMEKTNGFDFQINRN